MIIVLVIGVIVGGFVLVGLFEIFIRLERVMSKSFKVKAVGAISIETKTAEDEPRFLTREEKAEAAKERLNKNKVIIEEAEISDPVAKKMAQRFADKKFNQRLKKIIDDD